MGPESSEPISNNTGFEFVPLPADSPFLSDHGLGQPEPPPNRPAPEPPSGISQFPPSSRAPSVPPSSLPERPKASPSGTSFGAVQDSISSFPLYVGGEDPYAPQKSRSSTASIPIGAPVPSPSRGEGDLMERLRAIPITTTDGLQGRLIEEYLGPVVAQVVIPVGQLLEGSEPQGKLFRHKVAQHRLRQLQLLAQTEVRLEAEKLEGNAVLAYSVQMQEVESVLVLTAHGTAVRLG
ncbi:MAG: heavy metal-binding domain-containing protein [Fibrobacteria bacterium]|nr:heavy metal-binding domain-containing protein [Fibrobacteria bacterium]